MAESPEIFSDEELAEIIKTETQARRVYEHYPRLQRAFSDFNVFWAYLQAVKEGRVNICRGPGVIQSRMPA